MRRRFVLMMALVALAGCPASCPGPAPAPPAVDGGVPPAADAQAAADVLPAPPDPCVLACANLARLGCAEGFADNCIPACQRAQAGRLTDLHPQCLADAPDKAHARGCGSVRCP